MTLTTPLNKYFQIMMIDIRMPQLIQLSGGLVIPNAAPYQVSPGGDNL
jgi:hypothetical protein